MAAQNNCRSVAASAQDVMASRLCRRDPAAGVRRLEDWQRVCVMRPGGLVPGLAIARAGAGFTALSVMTPELGS